MGKRIEKSVARDRGQSSNTNPESHDDDPNKPPEPYTCTGHFTNDFSELCRRNSMAVIPPVVLRPHRPPSPTPVPAAEEKGKGKKDDKKNQPPPEPEPEPVLNENGEPQELPPKTYTTKERFEYFKPTVQVNMDNPDKLDTVTEVFVRGWKIDQPMMLVFKQCLPKLDRLQTINLWKTGLTGETLGLLAEFLPECTNLKNLILDNNPVKCESYDQLLRSESPVQHLSLRHSNVTDTGAQLLGQALGTTTVQNQKLLSLNLNGNEITDTGVERLAVGLRMNRTLLTLGLAHNQITDEGAKKLAEVVSKFAMTHEEIVERRKLLSTAADRKSVSPPPGGKRSDSRDRPGSVRSSHAMASTKGKSAKNKKDTKGGKEEDKHEKTKGKKDEKPQKKASVVGDTKGSTKKGHEKGKGKKGVQQPEQEVSDQPEVLNPLLDETHPLKDGTIFLKGNMNLISLNLSYNQITEEGVEALLTAVRYQTTSNEMKGTKPGNTGLMRLCLQKNKIPVDSEHLQKLNDLMTTRDPFYKPQAKSPDQESQH